ncbi:hypothetical protein THTE_2815 [Thermogutta terrifontis]|uniref:Uncharacterized protein n=1 Tax=Thermogutta terrifontis TaxID=1331910 RepID=A0A286RHJ0_9BACT|nr:hypothetical protein THTE_2815 [Thermogutta terrifontis]
MDFTGIIPRNFIGGDLIYHELGQESPVPWWQVKDSRRR